MGKGDGKDVPKNWPQGIVYLGSPAYSPRLSKAQLQAIKQRPADNPDLADIPQDLKRGPCPLVNITPISDPAHPACGQYGLFAARDLNPGTLIIPYLGEVHPGGAPASCSTPAAAGSLASGGGGGGGAADQHAKSDYDLWLDHDADVAVDAARMGNEARFVNDYRGVPGKSRPNAEFREVWDRRRRERGMAFFVLPAPKRAKAGGHQVKGGGGGNGGSGGIAKGEEILVSYGKGFWGKRKEEWAETDIEYIE